MPSRYIPSDSGHIEKQRQEKQNLVFERGSQDPQNHWSSQYCQGLRIRWTRHLHFPQNGTCEGWHFRYESFYFIEQLIRKRWENGQKFTDDEAATIMFSLFNSVNHIHSVSIIHRDIKPGTIFVIQKTFCCPTKGNWTRSKWPILGSVLSWTSTTPKPPPASVAPCSIWPPRSFVTTLTPNLSIFGRYR